VGPGIAQAVVVSVGVGCGVVVGFRAALSAAGRGLPLLPSGTGLSGFQNSATRSELRFLCGWLVLVEQAGQDGSAGDPSGRHGGNRMVGAWWSQLPGPVRALAVVMLGVLGQHAPEVAFAEDQHPVDQLGPGGQHEPLRESVRARAAGRDLHHVDAGAGEHRVEDGRELTGPVPDQVPEPGRTLGEVEEKISGLCVNTNVKQGSECRRRLFWSGVVQEMG
jgi:hypothetical protein